MNDYAAWVTTYDNLQRLNQCLRPHLFEAPPDWQGENVPWHCQKCSGLRLYAEVAPYVEGLCDVAFAATDEVRAAIALYDQATHRRKG